MECPSCCTGFKKVPFTSVEFPYVNVQNQDYEIVFKLCLEYPNNENQCHVSPFFSWDFYLCHNILVKWTIFFLAKNCFVVITLILLLSFFIIDQLGYVTVILNLKFLPAKKIFCTTFIVEKLIDKLPLHKLLYINYLFRDNHTHWQEKSYIAT